jgi:hypothetical protein
MEKMLLLPGITAAKEENYLRYPNSKVVWKSALDNAEVIMKALKPEDKDYMEKIADVERLLPGIVRPAPDTYEGYVADDYSGVMHSMEHVLGQRFAAIHTMVKTSLEKRFDYLLTARNAQQRAAEAALQKQLNDARAKEQADADQASLSMIKELYNNFKNAFESRNDSAVASCLSSSWQSDDGGGVSALQNRLRQTFRTFDEVRYNIQNLAVNRAGDGRYTVNYDVTITSRIYKRNITHEEKSTVSEEVTIDPSGKAKISKTTGGRFWYSK